MTPKRNLQNALKALLFLIALVVFFYASIACVEELDTGTRPPRLFAVHPPQGNNITIFFTELELQTPLS
jgi:hypothetical protein